VASLAIGRQGLCDVVWRLGLGQISLMAGETGWIRANEVPDLRSRVARETRRGGMCTDQWEASPIVLSDLIDGHPRRLGVTVRTISAELALVRIGVTAGAPQGRELRDRPAIVMTHQARDLRVRAAQGHAGLLLVIEDEVLPDG